MRVRRLLAAIVTTGLIAPVGAVVATSSTPASAATATAITGSSGSWLTTQRSYSQAGATVYGNNIYISARVTDSAGSSVYEGNLVIQRLRAGSSNWQTVLASRPGSPYIYDTIKATKSAKYRAIYSGTALYAPASSTKGVPVQRKLTVNGMSGKRAGFRGKLAPKAKVKIIVQKKVGKKFKKYKTVRSNRKGRFVVALPAPRRGKFHWKITFKGSKGYTKSVIRGTTYKR